LSAGASPQTPLGELTALPRLPSWYRGWASRGKGRREGRGKGSMGGDVKGGSPGMPKSRVGKPTQDVASCSSNFRI